MSIGDLYNTHNVVVGQAATFFAPANTALPALTGWDVTDPFKLTFFPTPWAPCGATEQGWTFGVAKTAQQHVIEEQSTPVATTLNSQNVTIAGALSEDISKTLALAWNATVAATAASPTAPGYDLISLSDTVIKYAVAMVTLNAEGFGRLIYAPSWTQVNPTSTIHRRSANNRLYAVQFQTVCPIKDIKVYNFTAAKTA